MIIEIDKHIRLELTAKKHAQPLFDAVDSNRAHLSRFLPWVGNMQSVEDFHVYINSCESLYQQGKEASFVILSDGMLVGRIGLHHVNTQEKHAAIGYWLIENAEGQGIISKACKALISYGFQTLDLHRIEIKAAVENVRSLAIPERLHFTKEGILRQAGFVNNKFFDLVLYSMLRPEWAE